MNENHRDLPPFRCNDGTYTDDTITKSKMMHNQFTMKHKENIYSKDAIRFHKLIDEYIENQDINTENKIDNTIKFLEILNRKITAQEVWKSISVLDRINGMGCDNIHNVMIIEGKYIIINDLVDLYNIILDSGYYPFLWKLSEHHGMGKPGKDASILKNIRDLQLTPTLSRVFERIMAWRILSYFKLNKLFNTYNIAYQGNKSIEDVFLCLDNDMWRLLEGGGLMEIIFFDFSKAFDTIWINGLIYKLRFKYGIHGKFLNWIKSFLKHRYNRVNYR